MFSTSPTVMGASAMSVKPWLSENQAV